MPDPRVLIYDIECGALEADGGKLYAFAYKWLGESKVHVLSIVEDNPPCTHCSLMKLDDTSIVKRAHAIMAQADVLITFNGTNFDNKLMTTKFMKGRLAPIAPARNIDLYQVARHKMRLRPKSLANISEYLQLEHRKTKLDWAVWRRAGEGDAKAMRYIVAHGAADVLCTEELYLKYLRPYVPNHPFLLSDRESCRRCGGRVTRDKLRTTDAGKPKIQYRCKSCGGYETRSV